MQNLHTSTISWLLWCDLSMAKPRAFISSTYYDLKHLRLALEGFVESLGFESVLSEKGSIAYAPDVPLDESCYREAQQADLMVLIVGGRYGSERSDGNEKRESGFYNRYDSITREEFRAAVANHVPLYIAIERGVDAEYQTFLRNRESHAVVYAHVDSVNIFHMIEEIRSLPNNNPVFAFDRFHELQVWLREQWAGLFQDLLRKISSQVQIATLAVQVNELAETNKTFKRYLESLMTEVTPEKSEDLINQESERLREVQQFSEIAENRFVKFVVRSLKLGLIDIGHNLLAADSVDALFNGLLNAAPSNNRPSVFQSAWKTNREMMISDINQARETLGAGPLEWSVLTPIVSEPESPEPHAQSVVKTKVSPNQATTKPAKKKPAKKKPNAQERDKASDSKDPQ